MVFCYAALGLIASIIGIATARIDKGGSPTRALNASTYVTTAIVHRPYRAGHADLPRLLAGGSGARPPWACWWA